VATVFRPRLEWCEERLLPSVFTVTDLGDAGIGSDLQGDLRYCITQANGNADPGNQVVFDPALSGTISLTQGPLTVSKDLDVDGPGRDVVTVSGKRQSGVFNISADPGVRAVTMSGLTIADGTGILVGSQQLGGGIYNDHADLTLTDCTVSGNAVGATGYGGGIYLNRGSLTVNSSTISGNAGGRGGGIYSNLGIVSVSASVVSDNTLGGGIFCAAIGTTGALAVDSSAIADDQSGIYGGGIASGVRTTITRSTISGNAANQIGGTGGGISFTGGGARQTIATISNCAIVGNTAAYYGGLDNLGDTLLLDHTTVSDNTARVIGGGIGNEGRMTITDCTIADNRGTGIYSSGLANLVMSGSTVSGNGGDGIGGGLRLGYGNAQISNCTFSGNTATQIGGGIAVYGRTTLELTSVTITGNRANGSTGILMGGGGLFLLITDSDSYALIRNSLIAGNFTATTDPDVNGTVTSLGFNLVGAAGDSQGWRADDLVGMTRPSTPCWGPCATTADPHSPTPCSPGARPS
jgi:predicted outer membrane repeat protein